MDSILGTRKCSLRGCAMLTDGRFKRHIHASKSPVFVSKVEAFQASSREKERQTGVIDKCVLMLTACSEEQLTEEKFPQRLCRNNQVNSQMHMLGLCARRAIGVQVFGAV